MRHLLHTLYDRITGRNHLRDCDFNKMDEKIAEMRKVKHNIANRTDVIVYEAYMGRRRREQDQEQAQHDDSASSGD
jgi:hypothetical protein